MRKQPSGEVPVTLIALPRRLLGPDTCNQRVTALHYLGICNCVYPQGCLFIVTNLAEQLQIRRITIVTIDVVNLKVLGAPTPHARMVVTIVDGLSHSRRQPPSIAVIATAKGMRQSHAGSVRHIEGQMTSVPFDSGSRLTHSLSLQSAAGRAVHTPRTGWREPTLAIGTTSLALLPTCGPTLASGFGQWPGRSLLRKMQRIPVRHQLSLHRSGCTWP